MEKSQGVGGFSEIMVESGGSTGVGGFSMGVIEVAMITWLGGSGGESSRVIWRFRSPELDSDSNSN